MKKERFVLGPLENNCYLLRVEEDAIIIDASGSEKGAVHINDYLREQNLQLKGIFITHGHFDHIDAAIKLSEICEAEVYLNAEDSFLWSQVHPDSTFQSLEQESIDLGGETVKVLDTPGHTPGSTCYYVESLNAIFTGDTLFAGGPGAVRWSYSSMQKILDSIESQLFTLPDDTTVYPGHGKSTTIKEEKDTIRRLKRSLDAKK